MTYSINFKCLDRYDIREQVEIRLKGVGMENRVEGNTLLVDVPRRETLVRLVNAWLSTINQHSEDYTVSTSIDTVAKWRVRANGRSVGWVDITTKE